MKIFKKVKMNAGMTYVELIVVLSIFSILSAVVIFNYGDFQAKVDIKNLASDVALKVVEAQRSSLSGLLPPVLHQPSDSTTWKPSYGVFFSTVSNINGANNTNFIYFTDLDYSVPKQNGLFDNTDCTGECLSKVTITKSNKISSLDVFYQNGTTANLSDLTISFSRPNSGATIKATPALGANINYVQVTVSSPNGISSLIKLFPSGRVQIN